MSFTGGPTIPELCNALDKAGKRYVEMLGQVNDPSLPAIGTWNVGETAAHLSSSSISFLAVARGESDPPAVDSDHTSVLNANPERDPKILADSFTAGEKDFLTYVRSLDGNPEMEIFQGIKVPTSTLLAVELSEVLVHGYDIAKASGLTWQIPKYEATIALGGILPLLTYMVDERSAAGLQARFDLRLRGGARAVFAFDDGRLNIEDPAEDPVDCCLSIDPVTMLLLSFNRIQPWRPLLQGKMGAWGRRFWLAGKFPHLFKSV